MSSINTGKVIAGGLLAGLVFNILDFVSNGVFLAEDFRANATRLGLDPAVAESVGGIMTWVVIDFLLGILAVFTYAAMRPRFGPGPKTAIVAGLVVYLSVTLVLFGLTQGGLIAMALFVKASILSLVTVCVGSVAGAWAYREA
ncbi:MAG TPA: hypothetical protein VLE53_10445 [Gemmatimonadaceae bacterium]|nr:hypothetical protein [Gemmatimonadaceae bacterium]